MIAREDNLDLHRYAAIVAVRSAIISIAFALLFAMVYAGCAATQPASPAPVAAIAPLATPAPSPAQAQDPMQQWNIFPDPTTGTVEIYHQGNYVGAITGHEPANEDPPLPHPVPDD